MIVPPTEARIWIDTGAMPCHAMDIHWGFDDSVVMVQI